MGKQRKNHDPLTDFMLGRNSGKRDSRKHHGDDWLFGKPYDKDGKTNEELSIINILNQVDVEKLAGNIDTLMTTASQFKPLIKQVAPLLKKWVN